MSHPPVPPPPPGPAINVSILELNLGALGDELVEMMGFLSETFLEDTPLLIGAIQEGLAQRNADQVRFNVHTLKSSSATLGAEHLAHLCLLLENQSKAKDLSQGDELVREIMTELERVTLALQSFQAPDLSDT